MSRISAFKAILVYGLKSQKSGALFCFVAAFVLKGFWGSRLSACQMPGVFTSHLKTIEAILLNTQVEQKRESYF